MSEEEKKTIGKLKRYVDITAYWKKEEYTNTEIDNYIKIILNLIEKQQNRIDELKNTIAVANKLEYEIKKKFIPKLKIEDKIKKCDYEILKAKNKYGSDYTYYEDYCIANNNKKIYKELLEEE